MADLSKCRSCGADIIWLVNANTGKRAPIDAQPSQCGNIAILPGGVYEVYSAKLLAVARPRTPLHTNHFMTCPQARQWAAKGGK